MSALPIEWKTWITAEDLNFAQRDCLKCPTITVKAHPLALQQRTLPLPKEKNAIPVSSKELLEPLAAVLGGLDPLQLICEETDPLTKLALEQEMDNGNITENNLSIMQPWSTTKNEILSRFTTSEKISFTTSFSFDNEKVVKSQNTPVNKIQYRLEQLDYFEEGSQRKFDLSQSEYIRRIEQLNEQLVSAWNSEQRVKALKIAIQCAKLLSDTDVLAFYPSKYVLITNILDIFGKLVYDRLKNKSEYYKPGSSTPTALPNNFTQEMVPDSAKETCLNWFYKIASIRELVPRLYVEMALLRSYNFISNRELPEALLRLTEMIQGIGNPLVAVYARCYLCRVGLKTANETSDSKYLFNNFIGFLNTYHHLSSKGVKLELSRQKMEFSMYVTLYTPALKFIMEANVCHANDSILNDILINCVKFESSSLILNTIISAFKPAYVTERSLQFLEMINKCNDGGIPIYLLLHNLGLCVSMYPPPVEQRKQILINIFKHLSSFKNPEEYISCIETWITFFIRNMSTQELNTLFGDIIEHVRPNRAFENLYVNLELIIQKVIMEVQDFEIFFFMDNFVRLIDIFEEESIRVKVCKSILTLTGNEYKTSDPIVINGLLFLCTILHDSVNALTPEDEHRQIGEIICNILSRIHYGQDYEKQLSFYVEARAAFPNMDVVLFRLVQCVNTLSASTREIMKASHNRRTGDFVRACAAYCFITIPSIVSIRMRLTLYLLSGRVALFNQCLGQADACFKTGLSIISELENNNDENEKFLLCYLKQFLSTLLLVPDNPEKGVLNLIRILLNVVRNYNWKNENGTHVLIYINVLDILSQMAQVEYPYSIENVESNNNLYGSDPKFIMEINNLCSMILNEILTHLKNMHTGHQHFNLASELFIRIIIRGDLTSERLIDLASHLWQLCTQSAYSDMRKYMERTRQYFLKIANTNNNKNLNYLITNLSI